MILNLHRKAKILATRPRPPSPKSVRAGENAHSCCTNLRRERQAEGIAGAKKRGVYTGGKKWIERESVLALHRAGRGPSAIAKELGISRRQVYRILEEAKGPSLAPSLSD